MADEVNKKPPPPPPAAKSQEAPRRKVEPADTAVEVNPLASATQDDIFPRPPINLTGLLDINVPAGNEMPPGFPGMIADTGIKDVISRIPEAAISFGVAVQEGTKQGFCKAAGAGAGKILGISVRDWTANYVDPVSGVIAGYPALHWSVGILRVGRIWVVPTTAVTRGAPVTWDTTDGSVGTGGATGPIAGMQWDTDANAGELALLQVNLN